VLEDNQANRQQLQRYLSSEHLTRDSRWLLQYLFKPRERLSSGQVAEARYIRDGREPPSTQEEQKRAENNAIKAAQRLRRQLLKHNNAYPQQIHFWLPKRSWGIEVVKVAPPSPPKQSILEDLLRGLPRTERADILSEAGVMRRIEWDRERRGFLVKFSSEETRAIAVPLLRRVRLTDEQFREIARGGGIEFAHRTATPAVRLRFAFEGTGLNGFPITQLAATSLIVWELSSRVAEVLLALEVPESLDPPQVVLGSGSANYTLGGGPMLVAGIGLIVAAHEAMTPGVGANFAHYGGALTAVLGLIDILISWKKTIAESDKMRSEEALNRWQARLAELDVAKKEMEVGPPAALIPAAVLAARSRQVGLDPAVGTHLVNQVLPTFDQLSHSYPAPITVASGSRSQSASASTSAD
jgi:hypothetical protein